MGHTAEPGIRPVRYSPPADVIGEIELNSLAGIRERGGPDEFLTAQRLDFDLLIRIEAGTARHRVDFTDYALAPGDVLWIRAGQVHQWGTIADIEGPLALFTPAVVDSDARDRIRAADVRTPAHWPAVALDGHPASTALDALFAVTDPADALSDSKIRSAARVRLLTAALLLLMLATPADADRHRAPTREAFVWFREELESRFATWHQVADYAARLGYSTRTLNRLARENTGLSAKQLIDERIVLEAKRALVHGRDPVARIAEDLGFDDASNFSKYFQLRAGITPLAFRTRASEPTDPHPRS
ncbi:helix-turn-helix domain-containing protein [Nocardia sp. NPDC059240]|uniref:AraC family transcriptional regulator n=1 Tax=Nocardia sp. NPDC059240 TaxID=3346786 RepID=UPI0036B3FED1